MQLVLTLLIGTLGGYLFFKLKVPAGMLVGAIVCVSILSISTEYASMPSNAKLFAQIITGTYIGSTINKSDILHLPKIIKPYLTVMITFFILNMIMGTLIYLVSPLDFLTSMLCAMPGGISDTPLIAMDMGADAAKVALLQFVRLVFGLGALPSLIVVVDKLAEKKQKTQSTPSAHTVAKSAPADKQAEKRELLPLLFTVAVAIAGGFVGKFSQIPAGALIISMLAVMLFKMVYAKAYLPLWCRRVAQVLSGCVIGCRMKYQDVLDLRFLIVPAMLLIAGYLINCVAVGMLLHKKFGFSRREGMLSVSPAGATEMALIAADLGVESPDLIVLQIGRFIGVMAIFPQIFALMM